jgi:hypothetical protein
MVQHRPKQPSIPQRHSPWPWFLAGSAVIFALLIWIALS